MLASVRQAKKISHLRTLLPPPHPFYLVGHAVSQRMGKSFEVASSVNNSLFISLLSPEASHIQSLQLVGIDDWLGRGTNNARDGRSVRSYPAGLETNFSFLSATFEKTKKEKRNGRRREERTEEGKQSLKRAKKESESDERRNASWLL